MECALDIAISSSTLSHYYELNLLTTNLTVDGAMLVSWILFQLAIRENLAVGDRIQILSGIAGIVREPG